MPIRSTRDRPAKAPLSREAVIEAGLTVLRTGGLSAVTMRAVAALLDTGPASLYSYVANRDELLHEMLNTVLTQVPVPPTDPARWREQLKDLLRSTVAAIESHPGIAQVAMGYIPTEPHSLLVTESMLQLLAAGGVGPQASAWAVDLLAMYATATAYEHSIMRPAGGPPDLQDMIALVVELRETFTSQPPDEFPMMTALALMLTVGDDVQRFDFGLDVLINGILATPEPATPPDPLAR